MSTAPRRYRVGLEGGFIYNRRLRPGDVVTLRGDDKPSKYWTPVTDGDGESLPTAAVAPVDEPKTMVELQRQLKGTAPKSERLP